ncbi:hypothetical protein BKA83DRAFT_4070821 [Pisolithus microcarpus]|nr:hypothetical protein BKA83DRAFT_4070821 [Pisolithus microcarpus]
MVSGNLMPRPPVILASLITVSFVGVGQLPKNWLHSLFWVHHNVVHEALLWLKRNNPKYYGNICIDNDCLQSLPHDEVPAEISSVIWQCEDIGMINQESEGYASGKF